MFDFLDFCSDFTGAYLGGEGMNSEAWYAIAKTVKYAAVATITVTAIMTTDSQAYRFFFFFLSLLFL